MTIEIKKKKQLFQYSSVGIQSKHHSLTLDYRGQDRIFQSEVFIEAWNKSNEDERKYVLSLFSKPDTYKLKKWILKVMIGGLEQYPINVLRQLASCYNIKNYSRMAKARLLSALNEKGVTYGSKNI